jgi:hypothetical protein
MKFEYEVEYFHKTFKYYTLLQFVSMAHEHV